MKKMYFQPVTDFNSRLPYFFNGVGISYEQEHIVRPSNKEYLQWIFDHYQWVQTKRGAGELILRGARYSLTPGHGVLLFPHEPHEYYAVDGEWETDWIILTGKHIDDFVKNILRTTCSTVYSISNHNTISDKLAELYRSATSSDPTKDVTSGLIVYEILMAIYCLKSQKVNTSLVKKSQKLEPVIDYIQENYAQPLTLAELAAVADLTPQYLCRLFKDITAQTVFDTLTSVRIQKSKELLLSDRSMPLKEIAIRTGFSSESYFCHVFRKAENISPAQYRVYYK